MMKPLSHVTAKASYYNSRAASYDAFNEQNSKVVNEYIEKVLRECQVKTVLDLMCGTGSQVFWLHKAGFTAVGVDINQKMLAVAKQKAKKDNLTVRFLKGDCRTTVLEPCDAVITIFNAIGHLTREDFVRTIVNVRKNLQRDGIYVFDIFNTDYLLQDDNMTKLTIDKFTTVEGRRMREIQFSTITNDGILASYRRM